MNYMEYVDCSSYLEIGPHALTVPYSKNGVHLKAYSRGYAGLFVCGVGTDPRAKHEVKLE